MRYFVFICLFGLLFSCSSVKLIEGVYRNKYEVLELKKDRTFNYERSYEYSKYISSGTWTNPIGDTIILKSSYNPENFSLDYSNYQNDLLVIQAKISHEIDKELLEQFTYNIILNESLIKSKFNERVEIEVDTIISSLQIIIDFEGSGITGLRKDISSETLRFDSNPRNGLLIQFDLTDEMLSYEYFDREIFNFNNHKLHWPLKGRRFMKVRDK